MKRNTASFNKAQKCVHKIFNGHIKEGEVNVINNEGHHFILKAKAAAVSVAVAVAVTTVATMKHCKKICFMAHMTLKLCILFIVIAIVDIVVFCFCLSSSLVVVTVVTAYY